MTFVSLVVIAQLAMTPQTTVIVTLLAQADLQRFALGGIYCSLLLFLIGAMQKELAWQAHIGI